VKPVPTELMELVKQVAPPEAEVVPLDWAYEHEDYNLAVVVPDTITYEQARQLEGCLIDAMMDYDATHGTLSATCLSATATMYYPIRGQHVPGAKCAILL
jgi:hypothetical protein